MIIWRRGSTILSAGQLLVTRDQRFSLLGHSLQLANVRPDDQGDYTCQIGDGTPGDLIHTVEILSKFIKYLFQRSGAVVQPCGARKLVMNFQFQFGWLGFFNDFII